MVSKQASPILLHSWEVTPCMSSGSFREVGLPAACPSQLGAACSQTGSQGVGCLLGCTTGAHTHLRQLGCPTAPSSGAPSAPALQMSLQDQDNIPCAILGSPKVFTMTPALCSDTCQWLLGEQSLCLVEQGKSCAALFLQRKFCTSPFTGMNK